MKFSIDSVLSRRTPWLLTVRERDCGIAKLKGVDGNGGVFCLVSMSVASAFLPFS